MDTRIDKLCTSRGIGLYWWKGWVTRRNFLRDIRYRKKKRLPLRINNFGDLIGPIIVKKLSGKKVFYSKGNGKLVSVGSIFKNVKSLDVVWGSGMMRSKDIPPPGAVITAVRGPLTRQALLSSDIDCPAVFGDPALLLPYIYKVIVSKEFSAGIIPHYEDYEKIKSCIGSSTINVINPLQDVVKVISDMNKCEVILSSSLHGVIVAEAYGIPSAFVMINSKTGGGLFKYQDYFNSTSRELEFVDWSDTISVTTTISFAKKTQKKEIKLDELLMSFPFLDSRILSLEDISPEIIR